MDGLRGYAILMVVATHAIAYAGLGNYERNLVQFWVQSVAVPSFFLVDGYLFVHGLQHKEKFLYGTYMGRSARRLLIPWIVFNILFTAFRAVFEAISHPTVTIVLGHTPIEILKAMYYSQIAAQLYFLPALFLIRSLSFGTRFFLHLRPEARIVIVAGYILLWQMVPMTFLESDGLDPILHAFWGMQYYLLGMVLVNYQDQIARNALVLTGIALICLLGLKWGGSESLSILAQFVYLLGLYFLFFALGSKGYPFTVLGTFTMGIYLFHAPIVLKIVAQLVSTLTKSVGVIQYVVITLSAVLISLALTWLCNAVPWCRWALGESRLRP
ncbi:MAG: acyltransferase [Nitrospira sp.]|nr:acyltransferase [Nitrospira sp.]